MLTWTYVIVVGFFLFAAPDAFARGFRAGGAAAHRSGAGRQVSIRNPSGFTPSGRITVTRTPTTFTRIVPARPGLINRPGLIKVAPIPVFVTPVASGFHHFWRPFIPTVFPRQNGILIIDGPDVIDTTVIIEVAPAIVYPNPPTVSPGQQSTPGRSADQFAAFDPTPQEVVERLLVLAGVKREIPSTILGPETVGW